MRRERSVGYYLGGVSFLSRRLSPVTAYFILAGGQAFYFTTAVNFNLVFQTSEARLDPFQLVLVGTTLQATIFFCEVPTGVLADIYSRRLSVVVGLCLLGLGLMLNGAFPRFETIILGQVIWGIGHTFISGARQAWIADEVGTKIAGRVYLRAEQVEKLCWIASIPLSTYLASRDLNLPILLGGGALVWLAAVMALTMSERGFRRVQRRSGRRSLRDFGSTLGAGAGLVRRSPLLITVFGITAFYGMASQGFDRLWVAHFIDNIGFPSTFDLDPVLWFGVLRMGSAVLAIAGVEYVRRHIDTASHAVVSRGLFTINLLQVGSVLVLAASNSFYLGMLAFWSAIALSFIFDPLYLAWINQNVESRVRATVISMTSQTDAIGRITGGPILGGVGSLLSLRAALVGTGVALSPALLLYLRAFRQGAARPAAEPGPASGG